MLYNRVNGFHMDTNDAREALKVWHYACRLLLRHGVLMSFPQYLKGLLTDEFNLNRKVKSKPVMGLYALSEPESPRWGVGGWKASLLSAAPE